MMHAKQMLKEENKSSEVCPTCLIERSEEDEMNRRRQSILDQRRALDLQILLKKNALAQSQDTCALQ